MRRGRARLAVLTGCLAAAAAVAASASQAPQRPPVFRGGVETVAIYATALDRYGQMVLNLSQGDFEVRDEGRLQTISVFESGLQPITAAILLDTSASMTLNLDLAREAAEQFVIRLLPGDKARVGTFSNRIDLSPAFTSNRDDLLRSFRENTAFGNRTMLWDAIDHTMTELASMTGRRVVMVLTDGMDTFSDTRATDLLARAQAEELMVYVVQFRSSARANFAEMPLSPTPTQMFGGDPRLMSPAASTETLRRLTALTGGGHFLLNQYDDVNTTFTHVMQELHYQYILGFVPERLDGRTHDLAVRVRKPDVTIRARRSYVASDQRPVAP